MTQKVKECVYPESKNCRGCMLHYRTGGGAKSLEEKNTKTAEEPDT